MNDNRSEYIEYRLAKSLETLRDAKLLADNNSWNSCVNRLYYACFYAVSALLLKNGLSSSTHNGLLNLFSQHFIKTGIIEKQDGKLYANLMDWRQRGDYGDTFDFNKEKVEPLLKPVEEFVSKIGELVKQ